MPVVALACLALLPEGRLACASPYLTERSPNGRWSLTVCSRPVLFAMPGGGSDAPGWIVLRDSDGAIRGVSSLTMLQLYGSAAPGFDLEWGATQVVKPMVLALPLASATGPVERWWTDRVWRLRALLLLTPSDETLS